MSDDYAPSVGRAHARQVAQINQRDRKASPAERPTLSSAFRLLGASCHGQTPCAFRPESVGRAFVHNHQAVQAIVIEPQKESPPVSPAFSLTSQPNRQLANLIKR